MTVIGANTVVSGTIEGDEDLTIEGRVEGTIRLSRTLTIGPAGVVHANISARDAVISGVLIGNVAAEDSVRVTEEGSVTGDIEAPRVMLAEGSSFHGHIDMREPGEAPPVRPSRVPTRARTTRPAPAPAPPAEPPKRAAPLPHLRPVGRVKAARKSR